MKRAYSSLCCVNYTPREVAELTQKSGLALELRVADTNLDLFTAEADVFLQAGTTITNIASSINIVNETLSETAFGYIDLAHKLGVKGVRIFAGENQKFVQEGLQSDIPAIVKAIRKLCEYAQEKGVEIWLETHSEISTGKLCRRVLDDVNMPNFKIIWDVLHSLEYHEALDETLRYIADDIVHIHLKDGVPPSDSTLRHYVKTDLCVGIMPFADVIEKLKAIGFDGYLSLEWESPWCPQLRELYDDPADLLEKYNNLLDNLNV